MSAPGSAQDPKVVHVYDDIEEEDDRLPNWWLFILFATIVFSFGYWFVYHTAKLRPLPGESYSQAVEAIVAARIAANPASADALLALSRDPEALAVGAVPRASAAMGRHRETGFRMPDAGQHACRHHQVVETESGAW